MKYFELKPKQLAFITKLKENEVYSFFNEDDNKKYSLIYKWEKENSIQYLKYDQQFQRETDCLIYCIETSCYYEGCIFESGESKNNLSICSSTIFGFWDISKIEFYINGKIKNMKYHV